MISLFFCLMTTILKTNLRRNRSSLSKPVTQICRGNQWDRNELELTRNHWVFDSDNLCCPDKWHMFICQAVVNAFCPCKVPNKGLRPQSTLVDLRAGHCGGLMMTCRHTISVMNVSVALSGQQASPYMQSNHLKWSSITLPIYLIKRDCSWK